AAFLAIILKIREAQLAAIGCCCSHNVCGDAAFVKSIWSLSSNLVESASESRVREPRASECGFPAWIEHSRKTREGFHLLFAVGEHRAEMRTHGETLMGAIRRHLDQICPAFLTCASMELEEPTDFTRNA